MIRAIYDGLMLLGFFAVGGLFVIATLMTFQSFFVIPILCIEWFQGRVPLWILLPAVPLSILVSGLGWRILDPVGPER